MAKASNCIALATMIRFTLSLGLFLIVWQGLGTSIAIDFLIIFALAELLYLLVGLVIRRGIAK